MLSQIPVAVNLENVPFEVRDLEAIRIALIGELDAVSLYEQLAAYIDDPLIKKVMLDIAKEEKTHIGELQTLLLAYDKEQSKEMDEGRKEVAQKIKNGLINNITQN